VPLIRDARDDEAEAMRRLLRDYERSIGIDLCFQDFEEELEKLPGEYVAAAKGAFLVADNGDGLVGCVALRAFSSESCEMKRLYVDPGARGSGIGRQLVESVLARARSFGYRKMLLDTLPSMQTAQTLYREIGFVETRPYRLNPVPGVTFLELTLQERRQLSRGS
jgi:N-acetylglutamate synthase-like GNAT family acetyltransferase